MSVAIYGVIHRLRWTEISNASIGMLEEYPTREWVELDLASSSDEAWGFSADAQLTLGGDDIIEPIIDTPAHAFKSSVQNLVPSFSTKEKWLIALERVAHC